MNIVFDLDGTLSDFTHRRHLWCPPQKDWSAFTLASASDGIHKAVCDTMVSLYKAGDHVNNVSDNCIEIWTSRGKGVDCKVAISTRKWLTLNIPGAYYHICEANNTEYFKTPQVIKVRMREHGDNRNCDDLKKQWLLASRNNNRNVDVVYDDTDHMVKFWRANGITCFQCANGTVDAQ